VAAPTALAEAVEGWSPGPVTTTDVIGPWPAAAFSALLDLPATAAGEGEALPPLWHWLHFLDHPRRSELGEDGHPADGHFLPPVPDRRRMFAGGRLRVHAPMRVGDRVERRTELVAVTPKSGRSGELLFVTARSEFRRAGELLATEEQDIVYRSQPAGAARPAAAAEPPAEPGPAHRWRIDLPTDPALLFRFSALTYNTHRIHYDQPYATGVEGYPGPVVHGPLLALLLLEIPRRGMPASTVTAFDFRLSRPAFAGGTVVATGDPDGDDVALRAGVAGAGTSISATARTARRAGGV
jgi:3-methylfumaryl-CoA hydratase